MPRALWIVLCAILLLLDNSGSGGISCNPAMSYPYLPYTDSTAQTSENTKPSIKIDFTKAVLKGAEEIEISNSYDVITRDKNLGIIYFHALQYRKEIQEFLGSPKYIKDQKIVVICLIQDLPLENYLEICKDLAKLYRENKIEEEVLMWIIAPNFGKRQIITRNYQNPAIISTLQEIRSIPGLSRTTTRVINQILSGDELKFL